MALLDGHRQRIFEAVFGATPDQDDGSALRARALAADRRRQVSELCAAEQAALLAFVHDNFAREWSGDYSETGLLPITIRPSRAVAQLTAWVEQSNDRLHQALRLLGEPSSEAHISMSFALQVFGKLRIQEAYDIVKSWPNTSAAIEELRYLASEGIGMRFRGLLTEHFSRTLKKRLLIPGTSTAEIIKYYIQMIRTFQCLDSTGVMLLAVVWDLQVYLRTREDTVRIIISGLLSDPAWMENAVVSTKETSDREYVPAELSDVLDEMIRVGREIKKHDHFDFDDMNWQPEPVDAGPGWTQSMRSKSARSDIIGMLIGVLGSAEIFVREFQQAMARSLLQNDAVSAREISLMRILLSRYNEPELQACQVMVRDIEHSSVLNDRIRQEQNLGPSEEEIAMAARAPRTMRTIQPPTAEGQLKPSIHTKILSGRYWPRLDIAEHVVPSEIVAVQEKYAAGYARMASSKYQRRLRWVNSEGRVSVDLEFADRHHSYQCSTVEATIIHAFQEPDGSPPAVRDLHSLMEKLEMSESMVRAGLTYWVNQLVLRQIGEDQYTVLETLSNTDREIANAQSDTAGTVRPPTKTQHGPSTPRPAQGSGMSIQEAELCWTFVEGMLKNNKPQMPVTQISMILKMLAPQSFSSDIEGLKAFLTEKVSQGKLDFKAGKYRLKK